MTNRYPFTFRPSPVLLLGAILALMVQTSVASPSSGGYLTQNPGLPYVETSQTGTGVFTASTGTFVINASLTNGVFASGPYPADGTVTVNVLLGANGVPQPGASPNLIVSGTTSDGSNSYGAPLILGTVTETGFFNFSQTSDIIFLRFDVNGGSLASDPAFANGDGVLRLVLEGSSFDGVFTNSFNCGVSANTRCKIEVGPVVPGILGDRVWEDLDGDGIQDCVDPVRGGDGIVGNAGDTGPECDAGVPDVPVLLYEPGPDGVCDSGDEGAAIAETTTDADGFYRFEDIRPQPYCVEFNPEQSQVCEFGNVQFTLQDQGTNNNRDSDADPTTGKTDIVFGFSGTPNLGVDAGIYCAAEVGDRVWDDSVSFGETRNGIQDADEPSIPNWPVELYRCDAQDNQSLVASTATDENGEYLFTGLAPGTYSVKFAQPGTFDGVDYSDYQFTVLMAGDEAAADSDANTTTGGTGCNIDLEPGESDVTWDGGVYLDPTPPVGSIGDLLFYDINRDGIQGDDEFGINGNDFGPIDVRLFNNCSTTPQQIQTTSIDANGEYLFTDLPPGDYCVEIDLPPADSGFCEFGDPQYTLQDALGNSADAEDSDVDPETGRTGSIALGLSEQNLTLDAGVYCPSIIGDRFWDDSRNPDGQQDEDESPETGEPGLGDITVNLYVCDSFNGTAAGEPIDSIDTESDGVYEFPVDPGVYEIEFVLPQNLIDAGYVYTMQNMGDDASDSDASAIGGRTGCTIQIGSNEEDLSIDGGAVQPIASLGDRLFEDDNGNGLQDDGETGVDGIQVALYDNGDGTNTGCTGFTPDDALAVGVTADGLYGFDGLFQGNYCVEFRVPEDFCQVGSLRISQPNTGADDALDSDINQTTLFTGNIFLPAGADDPNWDAGIYCGAELGDRIWEDLNADGEQACSDFTGDGIIGDANDTGAECSDTGIDGLTVDLLSPGPDGLCNTGNEEVRDAATTSDGGFYLFTDLEPGAYCVQHQVPADYRCTEANAQGVANTSDSDTLDIGGNLCQSDDPGQNPIVLSSNESDRTWDGGVYQLASLGDFVFEDSNSNGQQDIGEPGVAGVTVNLLNCTNEPVVDGNGQSVGAQVTGDNGFYLFDDLLPGCYLVEFVLPSIENFDVGFTVANFELPEPFGQGDAGDSDADTGTGLTGQYNLVSGEINLTVDAGLTLTLDVQPASLGNRVWEDLNANGIQDAGEPGVDGVTIQLLDSNGSVINTDTSANGGIYGFTDLPPLEDDGATPISYGVSCLLPDGYAYTPSFDQSRDDDSNSNADPSTGDMGSYSLSAGEDLPTIDCGLVQLPAGLGDFVFFDTDRDGLQDAGEPGIEGVTVTLRDPGGNGVCEANDNLLDTTTTEDDGYYEFGDLAPGDYCVSFEQPAGLEVSPGQQGGVPAIDSDGLISDLVTLEAGDFDETIDAGFYEKLPDGGICIPSIDFDLQGLSAGTLVSDQFLGVSVSAVDRNGNSKQAMIFDSAFPTGGDPDLGTPNEQYGGPGVGSGGASNRRGLDNILILSEDGDASDPDDDARGGEIYFDFDQPTQVRQVEIVDIDSGEDGGFIEAFDSNGNSVALGWIEGLGNNSYQIVELNAENVSRLVVHFPSSGGVGGLAFCPDIDIRKQEEGPDVRKVQAGDSVTFEIAVTNDGEEPLTNVIVTDPLLPACDKVIGSLAVGEEHAYNCTTRVGGGFATQTFADSFNQRGFDNNDGDANWLNDWTEYDVANSGGASQDPLSGNILVGSNNKVWMNDRPDTGTEPSLWRSVDLAGATSAMLSFDWTVHCGVDRDDKIVAEVSADGGANWTRLTEFTGFKGNDRNSSGDKYCATMNPESFDISAFASENTTIRFRVANLYGGSDEMFKLDNVVIVAEGSGSGGYINEACVTGLANSGSVSDCDTSEVVVEDGPVEPRTTPEIDIRKQAEGADERSFAAGDRVTFEIAVTNTGDEVLTNVLVSDPLLPACDKTIASLSVGGSEVYSCQSLLGSGATAMTFEDGFDPQRFDNNDGDTDWSTDWIEYDVANHNGAAQDPLSGRVRIGSNKKIWLNDYSDTGTEPSIMRTANLSGATAATLSFDWTVHCGVDANDEVVAEISADGGNTWTTLKPFTGFKGSDAGSAGTYCQNMTPESFDISAFASEDTSIRFRVANLYGGRDEMFKVDNVKIEAVGSEAEGYTNEACVTAQGDSEAVSDCDTSRVSVDNGNQPGGDPEICATPDIDGTIGDWDLNADFYAKMYEAGRSWKAHLSDAYVRYVDGRLYLLVLTTDGNVADQSPEDAWVKVYDRANSTQVDGHSDDFRWVFDGSLRIGYEASFALPAGSYDSVEIHLNVNGGDTASTGKRRTQTLSLEAVEVCVSDDDANASQGSAETVTIEAEDGSMGRWWKVKSDGDASGGKYITIRSGKNSTGRVPTSGRGKARYSFTVQEAGSYKLWGRVIAPNGNDDSFWVRIDGGDWVRWNDIPQGANWAWDDVHDADKGNAPLEAWLEAGDHTLELRYREDGTKLDKWLLTNDLTLNPNF